MVVDHLYVVGIVEAGSDTAACVNALFAKYKLKCANARTALFTFDELKANPMNTVGSIQASGGQIAHGQQSGQHGQSAVAAEHGNEGSVGMYIVGNFHQNVQAIEYHDGAAIAEVVKRLTNRLDYVNLVACNAGKDNPQSTKNLKFMTDFCRSLREGDPSLTPVIAAYAAYVDIVFPGAERYKDASTHAPLAEGTLSPENAGRKLIAASAHENKLMKDLDPQTRPSKKVFWQFGQHGPARLEGRLKWQASQQ